MRIDINNPPHKYSLIYADPPWSYGDKMSGHSFSLDHEYHTMTNEDIYALGEAIKEMCEKDATLFLWVTSPFLREGLETIDRWGFRFKTVAFCWSKLTKNGKKVSNLGRWTMGNVELCLLAVKGHPKRVTKNVKQLVEAERTIHSKKPDEVRNRIVTLMGDLPRVELFARNSTPGWDVWGDEAPDD